MSDPIRTPSELAPDCRQIAPLLPALPDGDLSPAEAARVEAHLADCPACRGEAEAFRSLDALLKQAPLPEADLPTGAEFVARLLSDGKQSRLDARPALSAASVDRASVPPASLLSRMAQLWPPTPLRLALIAAAVAALLALGPLLRGPNRAWRVVRLAGLPRVDGQQISTAGRLQVGEWLETDSGSSAQIDLPDVGQVQVGPNSRLRLLEARPHAQHLALARGELHAHVVAPPHLFFVDTPSAVAVDLGCAYGLTVDAAGRSRLRVTLGQVAFELHGRESIVPAGACCETRPGIGPGTPYFEDAPAPLRRALEQLDFENGGAPALQVVLAAARPRDSLTLWHLFSRLPDPARRQVFDRLVALVPLPPGVTPEGVLRGDASMLERWDGQVEETWW